MQGCRNSKGIPASLLNYQGKGGLGGGFGFFEDLGFFAFGFLGSLGFGGFLAFFGVGGGLGFCNSRSGPADGR
jgi:hypothetical protein